MLTTALIVAAFVAGLTGAWSPCGFSMVSTLGEHARGRSATLAACAAFVPGALLGGVLTFGSLAALGALLGGGQVALIAAAVLALAAAIAEARGTRIAPQIRRQVPEHWRRVLPLPVAAAGYGVLLGLGFTTFVLTFAVWALAGVALAVGDVTTGVWIGLAFAIGRSVPVVALAPFAERPFGLRATELMAERPSIYRGFRVADALALALCALALTAETADAATKAGVDRAADPSAAGTDLAWQTGATGVLVAGGQQRPTGAQPAVGGALAAWLEPRADGTQLAVVTDRASGARVREIPVGPGAADLAISDSQLAFSEGDAIVTVRLADGAVRTAARVTPPVGLGRPALDGDRLVFHQAGRRSSALVEIDLATGTRTVLRRATRRQLTNPTLRGDRLLYVETNQYQQALVLGSRGEGRGRTLLRIAPAITADKGYSTAHGPHRPGIPRPRRLPKEGPPGTITTLTTTALADDAAYVTRLRRSRAGTLRTALLRVGL